MQFSARASLRAADQYNESSTAAAAACGEPDIRHGVNT